MTRWWETRTFAVVAVLLSVVPLLAPTIPPLTDLPGHIGRYRVMLGTDAGMLDQWYRFDWRLVGNLGVDLLVYAIAPLVGLEFAVKLVVMAIVALTVTGILSISREAYGRVQPWAILALPLAYNYAFQFGFVNHVLAMALTLNAFALWLRLGRKGALRLRTVVFVPLSVLVWLAHVVGWGALGLLAFGAELIRIRASGRTWAATILRAGLACMPLALPLILLIAWRSSDGAGTAKMFFNMPLKIGFIATVFRDRWAELDMASAALLGVMLYLGFRSKQVVLAPAVGAACLLLLTAFLLLPYKLLEGAYVDMRLAPYIIMLALLTLGCGAKMPKREQAVIAAIGLTFFFVRTATTFASLSIQDRDWHRRLAALDHLPRGVRLLSFVGDSCDQPWAHRRLSHLPAMAIARRAAFSNDQWPIGGSTPLRIMAHIPAFDSDPSQMVVSTACTNNVPFRAIDGALRNIPREEFDYVWLINPPSYDPRLIGGMRLVWQDGADKLLMIPKLAASRNAAPH